MRKQMTRKKHVITKCKLKKQQHATKVMLWVKRIKCLKNESHKNHI